ncbi:hypothetical protein BH11BAC1_BH11BAC1_19990 [soil metagenome]
MIKCTWPDAYYAPTQFPGDLKKQECLYSISESDNGELIVAGNNSRNHDDAYLVKLFDDCEQRLTSFDVDVSTINVTYLSTLLGLTANTINSSIKVRGSIQVEPGETLTITGSSTNVEFADSRKVCTETNIIVKPGGTLIVENGAKLTSISSCPTSMWDGIQVWGTPSQAQTTGTVFSAQGFMQINSGAIIENARMGTLVGKGRTPTYHESVLNNPGGNIIRHGFIDVDFNHGGGVFQADGAVYHNNRRGVHFEPYPRQAMRNLCSITNSNFYCSDFANDPEIITTDQRRACNNTFVSMWGVHDISFHDNYFDQSLSPVDWDLRGVGLATTDADYLSYNNHFIQNTYGIASGNVTSLIATFKLKDNTFENNYRAIRAENVDNCIIYQNDPIDVGFDNLHQQYGLFLGECNAYRVEENNFVNTYNYTGTIGLVDNFSIPNNNYNEIYNNTFENLSMGNLYQRELNGNSTQALGLKVKCNIYRDGVYNDIAATYPPGISLSQNYNTPPPLQAQEANNEFQSCAGPLHLSNCSTCININKYWFHVLGDVTDPGACIIGPIAPPGQTGVAFNRITDCPPKTPFPSPPAQHTLMNIAKLAIDSIEGLIDGGSTETLMAIIHSGSRQERYDALLAATPYLTARVLDTLLRIPSIFSKDTLGMFMVANASLPDSIFNLIDTASTWPIDSANMDSLIKLQIIDSSATKQALGEANYWRSQYEFQLNEALSVYMQDTLFSALDSMINLLSGDTSKLRKRQLYEINMRKGDWNAADSMLTILSADYPDLSNYAALQEVLLSLFEDSIPIASLRDSSELLTMIDTIAKDSSKFGFAGARMLQRALLEINYPEAIVLPDTCHVPDVPGSISGPEYGQCGQTGVSYSITPVSGATSYQWTLSNIGGVFSGPTNLSSASINYRSQITSVVLSVLAINSCGMSAYSSITIHAEPDAPSVPTGTTSVCPSDVEMYSTSGSAGATSYLWTIPSDAIILGSSTGSSIIVFWGSTSGNISVTAVNACGSSETSDDLSITVNSCREGSTSSSRGSLKVFPNPTKGFLTLQFYNESDDMYEINVTDASARLLLTKTGKAVLGINFDDLDLSSYAKGIYFVNLKGKNLNQRARVTIE